MDPIAILCVMLGALIIALRAPLIFAPAATMAFYQRLLSSDGRVRVIAVVFAPLALALVVLPTDESTMSNVLRVFGWVFAAAFVWLFAAPGSYRRVASDWIDFFETSVDDSIIRAIGALAVALGAALIYYGFDVA